MNEYNDISCRPVTPPPPKNLGVATLPTPRIDADGLKGEIPNSDIQTIGCHKPGFGNRNHYNLIYILLSPVCFVLIRHKNLITYFINSDHRRKRKHRVARIGGTHAQRP